MNIKKTIQRPIISAYIIFYKLILGVFELLIGLGILFLGNKLFLTYQSFRDQELMEDPHDLLISLSEKVIPYLFEHKLYIILFLIVFGSIKIIGALGLYFRKHWGLDLLLGLTFLLLPFDLIALVNKVTFLKLAYFLINLLIALYLVQFKPERYFINLKQRLKNK